MNTEQPEALDLADWLIGVGGGPSAQRAAALLRSQHARITELEAQLEAVGAGGVGPLIAGAGFDAADMATAAAQGFRDGVAKEQQAGWEAIETAPKDGREVLGYTAEVGALVLYWDTMGIETDRWSDGMSMHHWAPTHWQPVPPPPSSAQREVSNG